MTIRRRVVRLLLSSCLLVGITGIVGVGGFVAIGSVVRTAQTESLPLVATTNDIAERTGRLCANLQEFSEQLDSGGQTHRNRQLVEADFESLLATLAATAESGQIPPASLAQLSSLRDEARQVHDEWHAVTDGQDDDGISDHDAEEMETKLLNLLAHAARFQRDMLAHVDESMESSTQATLWATRMLSGCIGIALLVVIVQVIVVPPRIARRLEVIREQAERIGAGDLDTRLGMCGTDEVDRIAVAFNQMMGQLKQSRRQLEHDALHDTLTGLPNRALFLERVEDRLAEARRHQDYRYAVMFMDLDHFKLINDSLGHAAGDALLRVVAERLQGVMHDLGQVNGSRNTIARLGGDEFTVLVEQFAGGDEEACKVAQQIQTVLSKPMTIAGHELTLTSSIGVVAGDSRYADAAALLRDADAALYSAKEQGRARAALFDQSMHESALRRLQLENDLRHAVDRGELMLYYQPIRDLESAALLGFEALIRWGRGGQLIPPNDFIPIAEENGMIVPIGEWVIAEAVKQLQQWRAKLNQPVTVSVNVSPRQLTDPNLIPHLRRVLAQTGVPPQLLIIEITESALVEHGPPVEAIAAIRALGCRIYVDDFGTGHSTLSNLDRYPIDGIKVDRGFVKRNEGSREQMAILHAVVSLAHNLNMPVVAEGVETPDQLTILQGLGCDRAQGYLFARPMPASQAESMLERQELTLSAPVAA